MKYQGAATVVAWWHELQPDPEHGRKGDRGALARLRRCATVTQAMQEAATMQVFNQVRRTLPETGAADLPRLALAASVLAHLREDHREFAKVARAIGPASVEQPETARLKPLRFRRLLETEGEDERLTAFRRLVALSGGKLPAFDLADSLLNWTEDRRRRWVFDYWQADPRLAATSKAAITPTEDRPA